MKRISFFILFLVNWCSCQKPGLEPKDAVHYLVMKVSTLSSLHIPEDYTILRTDFMNTKEQDLWSVQLSLSRQDIGQVSDQFRYLRRHSTAPGFGKTTGGWEYYYELRDQEQYKMIIDTFSNQIVCSHRILY